MELSQERSAYTPLHERLDDVLCDIDAHLPAMKPIVGSLYKHIDKLTIGSKMKNEPRILWRSALELAQRFGVSDRTVRRGFESMEEEGFLVSREEAFFEVTRYEFFDHEQWAKRHPGQCLTQILIPGTADHDPLGRRLHALSRGKVSCKEHQVKAIRKLLPDIDAAERAFAVYFEAEGEKKRTNVLPGFILALQNVLKGKVVEKAWTGQVALRQHFQQHSSTT